MKLDEAIENCKEKAEAEERSAKLHQRPDRDIKGSGKRYLSCIECANEHRQLAEWLRDYKRLLEQEPILDKIRVEIEQNAYPIVHGVNNHELGMTLYGILEVIDKYKAESEVQKNDGKRSNY